MLFIVLVLFILTIVATTVWLFKDVPSPTKLTKTPAPVSTQILDRNGQLLYEVYSDQNRTPIKLEDLPPYVLQATIAIEDKNFYKHRGLDIGGILRAAYKTLTGQRLEGGSTITQQLVKTAILEDRSRTITRKIKEAVLAIITEVIYSKEEILEMYLNNAPYGGTAYGIETASRQYFNKSAKDLSLAQATLLTGLPQAPTRYSPFGARPELATNRQQQVLRRMQEEGFISPEQVEEIKNTKLEFADNRTTILAPHFVLWVRDLLIDRYGEEVVNLGGLRVTTSLDLDLQIAAQASLSAEIATLKRLNVGNGAAIVTRPSTGEVLSMIGSKDYFDTENDGNVNVTLSRRQPGSSIKPINYAVGLLNGWTASTMFLDIPTCFSVTGQKLYCPRNYDNAWNGPIQMRFALGNSRNLTAIKQLALNGIDSMIATASAMGITGWNDSSDYGLSLTLGGGEVRMVDMAVAFGTFANSGVKVPLNPILKVETYQGQVLEELDLEELEDIVSTLHQDWDSFHDEQASLPAQPNPIKIDIESPYKSVLDRFAQPTQDLNNSEQTPTNQEIATALPEEVAFIISDILLDNNARAGAFGFNSELNIPGKTVSVKTGTTNDLRDNWTIGYTPDLLVATWVGNNDNSPMSYVASGVTGASPIWNDIMSFVLKDQVDRFPVQPPGVISAQVCNLSGLMPTAEFPCDTRNELFIKDHLPPPNIASRKQIWIRRDTHLPLMPGEDVIDLDLEEHLILSDPFTKEFCLDCPYPQETKPNPDNPDEQIPTGKISYPQVIVNYSLFQLNPPNPKTYLYTPTQ